MRLSRILAALAAPLLLSLTHAAPAAAASTFSDVWRQTQNGPYLTLPQHEALYATFFSGWTNLLEASAKRTLSDEDDVLPRFQKLVHPIGICFAGSWRITEPSAYTGYFAKGSDGLVIMRASEALGRPTPANYRAFGLAGKIFPTHDVADATAYKTANFFTVDDLGGADSKSFLDLAKTNEPKTSFHLSQLVIFPTLTEILRVFKGADANPGIRQVYEISELGLADPTQARTPHWFSLVSETPQRSGASDFRQELRLANFPDGLNFGIYVAEVGGQWQRLGGIKLTSEALSDGCDHSLHFHHPPAK